MISFGQLLVLIFFIFLLFGDVRLLLRRLILFFYNFKKVLFNKFFDRGKHKGK